MPTRLVPCPIAAAAFTIALSFTPIALSAQERGAAARSNLPRTADGKPDLSGIWQVRNTAAADLQDHVAKLGMPAGRGVVVGNDIPYQAWAAAKRTQNFQNRRTSDPVAQCYMPGVPRIMYLNFPFQIFQTAQAIAMTFEWSHIHRVIYTDGSAHPDDLEFWMGDSRGHWEDDTLVVDVTNHNDKTWLDMAGNFHTDALHVVEKYWLRDRDTIQYEATIEDAKAFTKPWTISMPLHRQNDGSGLLEYACQAEAEEENGAFPREERTWYPGPGPRRPRPKWRAVHVRRRRSRRSRRVFAGCPMANRICRASTSPIAAEETKDWNDALPTGSRRQREV